MSEPSDREKAAIRALYSGCMVREDMEALRGYVARVDRDLNDWEDTARKVVRLFDPVAKSEDFNVTPGQLHAVAQGVKAANKTLRERLADRGHTEACLTTYLDSFDPKCPTCNPKRCALCGGDAEVRDPNCPTCSPASTRCAMCGGNRDTCGHFVGAGAL